MAPALEDLEASLVVAGGGVGVGVVTPGVSEDEDKIDVGGMLAVGMGVAVDSGESLAASATAASNPVVQFRYAQ